MVPGISDARRSREIVVVEHVSIVIAKDVNYHESSLSSCDVLPVMINGKLVVDWRERLFKKAMPK